MSHIISVLSRLAAANLTVKVSKCCWCFKSFDFLGHHVGNGKLTIPQDKVSQIAHYIMPTNRTSLKSFLGLVIPSIQNSYHN